MDRDREEPSRSVNLGMCYVYTRVGAECGREGEGGRQYIRRDGNLSVVLGPRFLTRVRANPCDMYMSLVTLRHIHDPMLLS